MIFKPISVAPQDHVIILDLFTRGERHALFLEDNLGKNCTFRVHLHAVSSETFISVIFKLLYSLYSVGNCVVILQSSRLIVSASSFYYKGAIRFVPVGRSVSQHGRPAFPQDLFTRTFVYDSFRTLHGFSSRFIQLEFTGRSVQCVCTGPWWIADF